MASGVSTTIDPPTDAIADNVAPSADTTGTISYVSGLDGVRALSVIVLLAYHHGVAQARGGYLGVSSFFTLSGFLIAWLALAETGRTGRLSMRAFWERRARRLLPAALLTVAGVVALQHWLDVGSTSRFRGDLLATLGYVANWRFVTSGDGYAALFTAEAPVQHFWSLAVEEQCYLAFPLVFVALGVLCRRHWRLVGAAFGLMAAASFAIAWWSATRYGNTGLAYYGTHNRAGEILVGVVLAFVVAGRALPRRVARVVASAGGRVAVQLLGVAGLVGLVWLWSHVSLQSPRVFHGAILANAVCTALVVLACLDAPVGRVLGVWPLRALGKVSYGVYLFHWPLFMLLDEERTGLTGARLFAARIAATLVAAVASYHLVEAPIRWRRLAPRRPQLVGVLAGAGAVVVALVVLVPVRSSDTIELTGEVAVSGSEAAGLSNGDPWLPDMVVPQGGAERVARVLTVGDSVNYATWPGMRTWNRQHPDRQVHVDAVMGHGCPIGEAGDVRYLDVVITPEPFCGRIRERVADALALHRYDVVLLAQGHKDLSERRLGGQWRHFGDPVYDDWFRGEVDAQADVLGAAVEQGGTVMWATTPRQRVRWPNDPTSHWEDYLDADNDPSRPARLNEIVDEVVADRPGFEIVDVAGWLGARPGGEASLTDRPDGVHYTSRTADELAEWLVPQILDAAAAAPVS